jgi:hypothetical protein
MLLATIALALLLGGVWMSLERRDVWSISIYEGPNPLSLTPHPGVRRHPVLTAAQAIDVDAEFVADPFMVRRGGAWYLFFECLCLNTRRGVISVAVSSDGLAWRYQQVVLREPFHLSYPYVFEWEGEWYMVPESAEAGAVRLYRATDFPGDWQYVGPLLTGCYYDASMLRYADRWWLFAQDDSACLTLHHAEILTGPWHAHPASPIVRGDVRVSRPGGRLIEHEGSIIRFAQDGYPNYGSSVRALRVEELSTTAYREHELPGSPMLTASGSRWNASGMHHADPHRVDTHRWLASVDGNQARWRLNWRYGARRVLNWIM